MLPKAFIVDPGNGPLLEGIPVVQMCLFLEGRWAPSEAKPVRGPVRLGIGTRGGDRFFSA